MNILETPFTKNYDLITGCCSGSCKYCVAREEVSNDIGWIPTRRGHSFKISEGEGKPTFVTLMEKQRRLTENGKDIEYAPFPSGFAATYHRYRFDDPLEWEAGQRVVTGMFGNGIDSVFPHEWQMDLLRAEKMYSQHTYFNLTCNPTAVWKLYNQGFIGVEAPLPNAWFGTTVYDVWTQMRIECLNAIPRHNIGGIFLIIDIADPLPAQAVKRINTMDWVIIKKSLCEYRKTEYSRFWGSQILSVCKDNNIPVFMYGNLERTMGAEFVQEFPKGVEMNAADI